MSLKTSVTILIAALLIGGGVYFGTRHQEQPVGASGNTFTGLVNFLDNVTVGGYDYATSSQGASTYTAAAFTKAHVIEQTATAALTVTTPTAAQLSSAGFLPNVGDSQTILIHASTTKITIAGGTGVTIATASSTKEVAAGSIGRLECTRLGATEARLIWCLLTAD